MRSIRSLTASAVAVLVLASAAVATLPTRIERAIANSNLREAVVGVSVREAGPGTEIIDVNGDALLIPASNLKLITTGAALDVLGADFRFQTRLLRHGHDLFVVGDGDPAFGDPELLRTTSIDGHTMFDVESFMKLWVDAIVASGIEEIDSLIMDDRIFDREYVHPGWPHDQLNRRYCAQVSGLSFHLNQLHFFPQPVEEKRPSLQDFQPKTNYVHISNRATSRRGPHDSNTIWIARAPKKNNLVVYGNVKHGYRTPVPVTVHDMPSLFGGMLSERLRQRGILVGEVRLAIPGDNRTGATPIGPVVSTPMATVLRRCNQDSQNLYAEALLKRAGQARTGQPGSWLNGTAIARHTVHERIGSASIANRIELADGSGLCRENRIAPSTLTAWLDTFHQDEKLGGIFIDSLAVGGQSGTLRKRLGTNTIDGAIVHGKSGYINGVSCLSGYITTSDGRRRCFSVMINDLAVPVRLAKALQNEIVRLVAEDLVAQPAALGSD